MSSVWFRHSRSSRITGSSCRGGSVVVANRARILVTRLLAGVAGHGGERLVALERMEHRLVPSVDLGVAGHPGPQGGPAVEVGGERVERLGRRADLAGDLARELAEHVFLVGEVLVEGDPRAPSELRDPVDAAAVVALPRRRPAGRRRGCAAASVALGPRPAGCRRMERGGRPRRHRRGAPVARGRPSRLLRQSAILP